MPQQWDDDSFKRACRDYERKAADPRLIWLAMVLLLATMATGIAKWPTDENGQSVGFETAVHMWIAGAKFPPLRRF